MFEQKRYLFEMQLVGMFVVDKLYPVRPEISLQKYLFV